jgi:flavin-dependent dehydrogenase
MSDHFGDPVAPAIDPLAATSDFAAAAESTWQAVVVGAGPAGAAAAVRLATRGLRVLLVDATVMPRPKLCGCCLSTAAVNELEQLERLQPGAGSLPVGTVPLDRVRLATPAVSAVVPLPGGGVVSREALDTAGVRRAIAAGVTWLPGVRVAAIRELGTAPGGVSLDVAAGLDGAPAKASLRARLAVVAAGLATPIRIEAGGQPADRGPRALAAGSRVGVGTTLPRGAGGPPPGELLMAVSRWGYCGIVRLEDGRVDIAAAIDRRGLTGAGSPAAAIAAILVETASHHAAGLDADSIDGLLAAATFRGTPPLTRSYSVATPSGRVVRVGDAAGYVEPFTGEGMGWALSSARLFDESYGPVLAAEHASDADLAAAADRYADRYRGLCADHHARCRRVALAVRNPWLVGSVVRLARLAPAVAARVAPLVVGATFPRKAHG